MTSRPRRRSRGPSTAAGTAVRRVRAVPRLPPRRTDAHKGDFGRILVVGGSRGMIGAPALVANAALRSGAGLVTVACPESIQLAVATLCPCATSIPLPENNAGQIDPAKSLKCLRRLRLLDPTTAPSVVAGGPGLGQGDAAFSEAMVDLFAAIVRRAGVPIVLDADALNALAFRRAGYARLGGSSCGTRRARLDGSAGGARPTSLSAVFTPHPGEMARLLGISTAAVQRDRQAAAVRLARELAGGRSDGQTVVLLKGAKTIVTNGRSLFVNRTGNPGMATGGSGDVLTGVIAALIGQGLPTFDAAVLGVYVQGLAGDLGVKDLGEVSLTAGDLINYLPPAFLATER